jgi:multimeric flavodoxin WrbA
MKLGVVIMTKALLLMGSPRGRKSSSNSICIYLQELFVKNGFETEDPIFLRTSVNTDEKVNDMLKALEKADIIVLVAPLYDDTSPAIVVKTMEAMAREGSKFTKKRFFPIINCGLSEPFHITEVSIPIYHKFATTLGLQWVGSLALGAGEGLQGKDGKLLHESGGFGKKVIKALDRLVDALVANQDFGDEAVEIFSLKIYYNRVMRPIMVWVNNRGWKKAAAKNGGDVAARPYSQ